MKKSKVLVVLLCLAMLFTLVTACKKTEEPSTTSGGGSSPATSGGAAESPSSSGGTAASPSDAGGAAASPSGGAIDVGAGDSSGTQRDTLSIAIDSDNGNLFPALNTTGQYVALQCIYEPLWDIDEDGNMLYVLMESYEELAPDHWRVKLREGITFSNGVELTASDVVFSLGIWKQQPVNSVRVQSMDPEKTAVYDKYTVDLFLLNGYYYFHDTASSMFMIFCEEGFDEDDMTINPIGTGPYVLKEYVINSHLVIERRDDYWGVQPPVKTLQFRVLAEPSQVVNALTTGLVDYARITLPDYEYVNGLADFNTVTRYLGGGVGLSFNSGVNGFFNRLTEPDRKLMARFALYHAIDPTVLINIVYEGMGEIMRSPVPDYMFDYKPEYNHLHEAYEIGYNVERAKELAEASGLSGQTIRIMTNGLAEAVQIAEIIQNMCAQIGVTLQINNYDPATTLQMIYDPEAEYDISVGAGIAPNWRVCDLLLNGVRYSRILTAPGAFTNNDHYLDICAGMAHEADPAKRIAITEECLQMWIDNAIGFGLCKTKTAVAISKAIDLSSVRFSVCTGTIRLNDIKLT